LVGFALTGYFQDGFQDLPRDSQHANSVALALMFVVLGLLIAPCTYHQLAARELDQASVHRFTTRVMTAALFPFGLGLGLTAYVPAERILNRACAIALGMGVAACAGVFWYGPALLSSLKGGRMERSSSTSTHDKIRQALTEARVIIPGNQALLGFQFAIVLQRSFSELPRDLKWIHLASLSLLTMSTILLMTPAAFHRLAENGEETRRFYRVAHSLVISSLPPLALGMSADFYIVLFKVSGDREFSLVLSGAMLLFFLAMWFMYPLSHRQFRRWRLITSPEEA
jgi:hypothetical protein